MLVRPIARRLRMLASATPASVSASTYAATASASFPGPALAPALALGLASNLPPYHAPDQLGRAGCSQPTVQSRTFTSSPTPSVARSRLCSSPVVPTGTRYKTCDVVQEGDAEAFRRIVAARNACRNFDPTRPVPLDLLKKLFAATLRSPTPFNIQPFSCVAVTDPEKLDRLRRTMVGNNPSHTKHAPCLVLFAADREAHLRVPDLQALLRDAGSPVSYVEKLPMSVAALRPSSSWFCSSAMRPSGDSATPRHTYADHAATHQTSQRQGARSGSASDEHHASRPPPMNTNHDARLRLPGSVHARATGALDLLVGAAQGAVMGAMSTVGPSVAVDPPVAWAYKGAMPAMQTFLLAAASEGLSTLPMEGFDAIQAAEVAGIPTDRYSVPVIVAVGYPSPDDDVSTPKTPRFPARSMFKLNSFDNLIEDIPEL